METLIYVGAAIGFFALIMASIALHEIGHLIPAKIFDVKTTQYFVGFGRTLWSTRIGETEYGVKALPLGGFVRMVGMYPRHADGSLRASSSGLFQNLADSAREFEHEEIRPEDEGRLFYQKKPWQKLIIMFAGPLMNLLLAFALLQTLFGMNGIVQPTLEVTRVQECVIPADRAEQVCQPGDPLTPAVEAGLQPGDVIVGFNGVTVENWDQLSELIRTNYDRSAQITVERGGSAVELPTVNTIVTSRPDDVDPAKQVAVGFLGVEPGSERVAGTPGRVVETMVDMTHSSIVGVINLPVRVYYTAADLVTGQQRDPNGPMSVVGASRVAGEVATTDQLTNPDRGSYVLLLLGSVNLFVAVLNLVPLMPFDGGHIAGALWEWLRRGLAKVFGRPDPGYVDVAKTLPVAYLVGGFLMICGVVLIVADVVSPITLF
ncbi:M50 family metallopeptidase [Naumannella halotolerans]|uniref:Membrane-associated protease RseP (Regulator of RpoE activity) n=1 Tax=Naumannella halotolerans TaxID=993414 RepID=A0A4R7J8T6_9ACTN|nr:M50 family metallopeptidase [Naumannella halotolerans]TDT32903.1 membrane-associated protease RseP (regulator of RpoE activity) [Naumannella halotolerans]